MIALLLKVVTVGLIIKQAKLYNNMHARIKTLSGNVPIMVLHAGSVALLDKQTFSQYVTWRESELYVDLLYW